MILFHKYSYYNIVQHFFFFGKYVGLDPAATLFLNRRNYIKSGDAKYVQLIQTSKVLGTSIRSGDIHIVVKSSKTSVFNPKIKHTLAQSIHVATSNKKLIMIAEAKGVGTLQILKSIDTYEAPKLEKNEYLVGVYSEYERSKHGRIYEISLVGRSSVLKNTMI